MQLVLEATCKNGALLLNQNLGQERAGRKFKVLLVDEADEPVQPNVLSQCGVLASVGTSTPNFYLHNLSGYDNI